MGAGDNVVTGNTTDGADLRQLREDVALSHRLMYLTGLGTTRGHSSALLPGGETFLIKPWPHIQMHRVEADDLIVMDLDGNIVGGDPSKITKVSEWPIHAEIYRRSPEVGAVTHTHQRWASMMALAGATVLPVVGVELAAPVADPPPVYDEDKSLIRRVSQGKTVAAALDGAVACHLQNHGMVFVGPDVATVTMEAIQIEYQAEMTWRAMAIGEPRSIPKLDLQPARDRRDAGEVARRLGALLAVGRPPSRFAAPPLVRHLGIPGGPAVARAAMMRPPAPGLAPVVRITFGEYAVL